MRAIFVHILAVLLIAIFAVGSPSPAKADCMKCHDCQSEAPAKNDAPCPEKGSVDTPPVGNRASRHTRCSSDATMLAPTRAPQSSSAKAHSGSVSSKTAQFDRHVL